MSLKFKVARKVSDIEVEVFFDSLDEVASAMNALSILAHHALMEKVKLEAKYLWIDYEGRQRISDDVEDNGAKVALSLLESWPASKSNSDIVKDTGLSRAGVYDQLTGRRGDKGTWFKQDGDLYAFTNFGENEVISLIGSLVNQED
jgi:hypothetical protein